MPWGLSYKLQILWPMSFLPMSSDRIIVEAIKEGQNLLSQNLPPAHSLTDAATVMRFRELVRSQAIRSAFGSSALMACMRVTSSSMDATGGWVRAVTA